MFKLDVKKFKKIGSDEKSTTLKHPDGHSIVISHKPLSKELRSQLDSLPMDHERNKVNKQTINRDKGQMKMADGGEVDKKKSKKLDIEEVKDARPLDIEPAPEMDDKEDAAQSVYLAEGGEPEIAEVEQAAQDIKDAPLDIQPASEQEIAQPQQVDAQPMIDQIAAPVAQQPSLAPAQPAPQPKQGVPEPDLMHGYQSQMQGIQGAAAAEGALGKEQAKTLGQAVEQENQLLHDFKQQYNDLDLERKAHIADINNNLVDPKKYWDDHSKMATGIGIILAGFNPTNRPNAAIEFLNHQMDRNIQSQIQNIQTKNSLLNANLHQFGNMKDAITMTKVMQNDMVANQLKQEAAKATDPLVRARALQAAGQLEMQAAPEFLQLNMRRMLQQQNQGATGQISQQDPASYVPFVVPKEHQKEVFHEIDVAKNTSANMDKIMKNFDDASKENTVLQTGAGLLRTPASVLGMRAMMLPIIHDAEGRVNEFEQKTTSDLEPKPGDTAAKVAAKRVQLLAFLNQKRAASMAKGFGVDMEHFESTRTDPTAGMTDLQKNVYKESKQRLSTNPNDPYSLNALKQLGVK